jgi:hypothetical protein
MISLGNFNLGGLHEQVGKDHRARAFGACDSDGRAELHGKRKPGDREHRQSGATIAVVDREHWKPGAAVTMGQHRKPSTAVTLGQYRKPGATVTLGPIAVK